MLDTGTTAFMIACTALVVMMSPALALFYGGLSRRKNTLNTMFMSIFAMCVVGVIWVLVGDSIAYGGTDAFDESGNLVNVFGLFFGGTDRMFSGWSVGEVVGTAEAADTYPSTISIAFQASFAMVTTAIVTGSLAGRLRFRALAVICILWPILVYAPMAHMVWGGGLIGNEYAIGAIDFAGGTAVHICSGVSGLVLALLLRPRSDFGIVAYRPHNVANVVIGAGLLFVGWFGFNGGSALAADENAGLAVLNTLVAACAAGCCWTAIESIQHGKPTLVGLCTGVLAGLVVITPACGYVTPGIAIIMGIIVSPICYFFISKLKTKLGWDDALDAFGCHGIGGMVGALLTGVFAMPELSPTGVGGLLYTGSFSLLGSQFLAVCWTILFAGGVSLVIGLIAKAVCGGKLRVAREVEMTGLDIPVHAESCYPAFNGLD